MSNSNYTSPYRGANNMPEKSYKCNYCGFTGEYPHSCQTYMETLKVYEMMTKDVPDSGMGND